MLNSVKNLLGLPYDKPEFVNEIFDCLNNLNNDTQNTKKILSLLSKINNINMTKTVNDITHNLLTCYIMYNEPKIKIINNLVNKKINLEYFTDGQFMCDALMLYFNKPGSNDINIVRSLAHQNICNSYYFNGEGNTIHNLISMYLLNNDCPSIEIINFLIDNGVNAHFRVRESNGDIYNNMIVWYIKTNTIINLNVLKILLESNCAILDEITINDFTSNNYEINVLLIYLKKFKNPNTTVIDLLMDSKYKNYVSFEMVIYDKMRVYNILTWYISQCENISFEMIQYFYSKCIDFNFIDNRSNNAIELYLQNKDTDIDINILKFLHTKKLQFNEYCMVYYLKNREKYSREIVDYLLNVCVLTYHSNWHSIESGTIYNILINSFSDLKITKPNYYFTYCIIS